MPVFLSICGLLALAVGAWATIEACSGFGRLADNQKRPFIELAEDALTYGAMFLFGFSAAVSALHSLTGVWL